MNYHKKVEDIITITCRYYGYNWKDILKTDILDGRQGICRRVIAALVYSELGEGYLKDVLNYALKDAMKDVIVSYNRNWKEISFIKKKLNSAA